MIHERAAILAIGDELLLGQSIDTNSAWIAAQLVPLGIEIVEHATVADDLARHVRTLRRLAADCDLLISTGGLGPTEDDLTRHALAEVLGDALLEDAPSRRRIEAIFRKRPELIQRNLVQALRPESAESLANDQGTAPGLYSRTRTEQGACDVFCLPGPPHELHPMFEASVRPRLAPPAGRRTIVRIIRSFGLGESDAASRLGALLQRDRNPLVGITASDGVISCRIRYEGHDDEPTAQRLVTDTEQEIRSVLGPIVFGTDDDTLVSVALERLRARGESLRTVESCTGGMIGATLTAVAGSSDVYEGGWVTYSNAMKTAEVGVDARILEAHGAVSRETAEAMATGGLRAAPSSDGGGARHCLAVTGVAGPGGGGEGKPVGTVWIARATAGPDGAVESVDMRHFRFRGDRETVRRRTAQTALAMLLQRLNEQTPMPLLWQVKDETR